MPNDRPADVDALILGEAETAQKETEEQLTEAYWTEQLDKITDAGEFQRSWARRLPAGLPPSLEEAMVTYVAKRLRIPRNAVRAERRQVLRGASDQPDTHGGWANRFIDEFGRDLVADEGSFWRFDAKVGTFSPLSLDDATVIVGAWDGPRCKTRSDYKAIAGHAYDALAMRSPRFADAPIGLACGDSFLSVDGTAIREEPLRYNHLARFKVAVAPDETAPRPLFDGLLDAALPLSDPDSAAQRLLLAEHFGAALFGFMWRQQKVALWFGPGSSGKSTCQKILRALFPPSVVSAVAPHLWEHEYHAAVLAGKALNVVGEISDKNPLGAAFKNIVGNDLTNARHPTHRPFSFVSRAAQVANCNSLPPTTDRSDAFWRRWTIVHFKYVRAETERDELLAEKIVAAELAGVLGFALSGLRSMLANGMRFSRTDSEAAVMASWRRQTNSVESFVMDDEWVRLQRDAAEGAAYRVSPSALYSAYTAWCAEERRHAFGSSAFKEQLGLIATRIGVRLGREGESRKRVWEGLRLVKDEERGTF